MTDLALPKGLPRCTPFAAVAARAFQERNWGRLKPNRLTPPTRKNSRRVGPSQVLTLPPGMLNINASYFVVICQLSAGFGDTQNSEVPHRGNISVAVTAISEQLIADS